MNKSKMSVYMKNRRHARKQLALDFLGGVCAVCGVDTDLDFDHIDPKTKLHNISSPKLLDGCIDRFWEEVKKCQLLCRSCHIKKTQTNSEYGPAWNKHPDQGCGTGPGYAKGCRCEQCKQWKKLYRNKLVDYSGKNFGV